MSTNPFLQKKILPRVSLYKAVRLTHVLMHHPSCYPFPLLPISSLLISLYILLCLSYIPIYAVLPIQPGYPLLLFLRRGCFITSALFALVGNNNEYYYMLNFKNIHHDTLQYMFLSSSSSWSLTLSLCHSLSSSVTYLAIHYTCISPISAFSLRVTFYKVFTRVTSAIYLVA